MKKKKGKLIVIDGLDGSGKATQTNLLIKRLKKQGYKTAVTDFPQYYKSFFGKMVGRYLAGEFGTAKQVSPYLASILYSADRWEAKEKMKQWLGEGRVVISNRYVSANQIHQAGKIRGRSEKIKFLKWLSRMEFEVFGLPKPNLVIFLDVPINVSQRLVIKKGMRKYLGGVGHDIHEASKSHLAEAQKQVFDLVKKHTGWKKVECFKNGRLLTRQEIAAQVWQVIKKRLK